MKLAVVFCVHHKPWLIMSTLITTLAQDYKDYDIYFIHNQGDGTNVMPDTYNEYYKLSESCGVNPQLSAYNLLTEKVCKITGKNVRNLHFDNDHSLDSGAWYKFIKTGIWRDYDYVFFAGEGALLVEETVVMDTLDFMKRNNIHFITGSQDKRRVPKEVFLNQNVRSNSENLLNIYHDRMLREVFSIFFRDETFKIIYDSWGSDFEVITENHVPDIWGYKGQWMKLINIFYPNGQDCQRRGANLSKFSILFSCYNQLASRLSIMFPRKINNDNFGGFIYAGCARKKLKELVDFKENGRLKFHKENSPEWIGCCCNHFVSKEFLHKFTRKMEEFSLYDVLKLPFSGTALEAIWGFIPLWLGFDKWFFNGIHRVRKNFVNYRREDNQEGIVRYLNRYYTGKLSVGYDGEFIKIKKTHKNFDYLKKALNNYYF